MAFQDFLLRARRPVSLIAFNDAVPANFMLIHQVDGVWQARVGVSLDPVPSLALKSAIVDVSHDGDGEIITPAVLSSATHYNLRVIGGPEVAHHAWSGWENLFIESGDPDFDDGTGTGDPRLDNSKLKRWFKNNGVERLDTAAEHPRSGRTDMRWFRWEDGPAIEWLDITIDAPVFRRRKWSGEL